jgi:hypothetical protein
MSSSLCQMNQTTIVYSQQKEVRAVMEGYIGKPNSNPTVILVSTPKLITR